MTIHSSQDAAGAADFTKADFPALRTVRQEKIVIGTDPR
jgi:hypothetical protein